MNPVQIASIILALAALAGTVNYFFLKLPQAIGIMVAALLGSIAVLGLSHLHPAIDMAGMARELVHSMQFSGAFLEGMLGLLLFAGALHVTFADLREQRWPILLMASLGILISTIVVGFGFSWVTGMPLLIALIFGALISPTDPVAVLGILQKANIRKSLEAKITGEALFNDGVGYALYLLLVGLAFGSLHGGAPTPEIGWTTAVLKVAQEVVGGLIVGAGLGWLTFRIMRRIDDYALEVLLTLALAFGSYTLALALHVSAPIAAVMAGLMIGNVGRRDAMSETSRLHVEQFWHLVDEMLNAALFVMIGIEIFALSFANAMLLAVPAAILLSLIGRFTSVLIPIIMLHPFRKSEGDVIPMLTWGGVKGGISVALALSLPESEWKPLILAATYGVVIFSVLVQGLTVGRLAKVLEACAAARTKAA
ncbi:cation:proton antiporter [Paracoccus litorisediminis]|uniref:cation:proton antiporter n=1 Tax=Paracoccus litorisediminis TaxID=2006130 RepID=UPI00372DA99C